jgi:phosphate butyryltransferase
MIRNFEELIAAAKKRGPKRVAVACGDDVVSIEAAREAKNIGLADFILVGNREKIEKITKDFEILDIRDEEAAVMEAVRLVSSGKADVLLKGHTKTSTFLKGVLNKEWGLRTGRTLSHIAVIESNFYKKLLFLTDGGMNIRPDIHTKIDIILNAVDFVRKFEIHSPKVAILSAVETVNPDMPETLESSWLTKMGERGQFGNCNVDGPLALDLAVSKESVKIKGIKSKVAGDADILIVPDIVAGNISAKALLYLGGAKIGGIISGAKRPCIMLSRADKKETKLHSIALGVMSS